jgi:DNA-directed RNA polymerase specialized sigma24 family protein
VTADSKIDQPAIEQQIAAFYETGRPSELLGELLLDAVQVAVRKSVHTFGKDIRRAVKADAPSHVWEKLCDKKYCVSHRFQPWCNQVVRNLAIDAKRDTDRNSPESGIGPSDNEGPGLVEVASSRPGEDAGKAIDDAAARREIAGDFEQSLPAAIDRLIFASRFEYLDSVSDTVLGQWCRDANKPDLSGQLREIHKAPRKRRYQMLAELLGLTNATVRQRACRAKKLLQARFPDCGESE